MIRIALLISLLLNTPGLVWAQELNCTVTLNTEQLAAAQKTDLAYFDQLKAVISEFMNNRRWSTDQFASAEKINCTLTVNLIQSTAVGVFRGNACSGLVIRQRRLVSLIATLILAGYLRNLFSTVKTSFLMS